MDFQQALKMGSLSLSKKSIHNIFSPLVAVFLYGTLSSGVTLPCQMLKTDARDRYENESSSFT